MKKLDSFCLSVEHTPDYSHYKLHNILFKAACFAC